MTLKGKQVVIASMAAVFLLSLLLVQWLEVTRRAEEAGLRPAHVSVPAASKQCVSCHGQVNPGIVGHWEGSTHAEKGVACVDCHRAGDEDVDGYDHYGYRIATIVTPRDCSACHQTESAQFASSHHANGGNILDSLDNFLAETVEGSRQPFNPHGAPGSGSQMIDGMASANSGCRQCHGSKVALEGTDGLPVTVDDLEPDEEGIPTNQDAVARIAKDDNARPILMAASWPNTGIGRINLDGSLGSCSACHSRHDFSPRRARQPENCGKCHLGPDHPQKEIYEESKHGVAYRDLKDEMNLNAVDWVLGEDYSAAPTCATCHMSGNIRNGGRITHDPGERISWTNRPPVSVKMDTDLGHNIVPAGAADREALIHDTADQKRQRMKDVCSNCHTPGYVNGFYEQYDALVALYNNKFGLPGQAIVGALTSNGIISKTNFDDEVEWTWFYLWHHEGRRARHGASMMAPDYTHWHGMFEVAERFYMGLIPQSLEAIEHARAAGNRSGAERAERVVREILDRPEHAWFEQGAEDQAEQIQMRMRERYGAGDESQ
jgi:hydroxylamine dehydrogenase